MILKRLNKSKTRAGYEFVALPIVALVMLAVHARLQEAYQGGHLLRLSLERTGSQSRARFGGERLRE